MRIMLPTGVIWVAFKKWFFYILKSVSIGLNKFVLRHRAALHEPTGHMGALACPRGAFGRKRSHIDDR